MNQDLFVDEELIHGLLERTGLHRKGCRSNKRKVIIAGNWKMNKTISEALDFINVLVKRKLNVLIFCDCF